jgi:5-methylcytosine-specific restriction endonuclease McrA
VNDRQRLMKNRRLRSERMAAARAKGTHTKEEWEELVNRCDNRCVRCGASPPEDYRPVKDHITPVYQGGSDGLDNLQPLCPPCNSAKGPESKDWRPESVRALYVSTASALRTHGPGTCPTMPCTPSPSLIGYI